ncbi:DsbA family protein [Yinghuangia soli]|uniref:DsbA family protein n=1 Tax=Yinghuangia soli TaxID=2908204 RepID=A0AA41PXV3_9ACTN|nr:thioredoxin domain-containing protein [Yinghuangia soli]MCF2527587.1 DsbA family protein [Yinghuangia soli]
MRLILSADEGPTSRAYRRRVLVMASVGLLAVMMGILAQFSQATSAPGRPAGGVTPTAPAERTEAGTLPAGFFPGPGADGRVVGPQAAVGPMSLGRADAPVLMVEYSDFNCHYCGVFARETSSAVVKKYVDTGVLRIEYRSFPIRGESSYTLAQAAWAAGQQGRFWPFYDVLFDKGARSAASEDALVGYARAAGVPDLARFSADAASPAARAAVDQNVRDGVAAGVEMTPTFVINGKKLVGALPKETFFDEIDRAARNARMGMHMPF